LALHRFVKSERQHQRKCENDPLQRSHSLYFMHRLRSSVNRSHLRAHHQYVLREHAAL
jgi:hypothetical protein